MGQENRLKRLRAFLLLILAVAVLALAWVFVSSLFTNVGQSTSLSTALQDGATPSTPANTSILASPTSTPISPSATQVIVPPEIAALLPNPGFEVGFTGWTQGRVGINGITSGDEGYQVVIDTAIKHSGTASARVQPIKSDAKSRPTYYANISTKIPADIFRGHRVRFSAYMRSQDLYEGAGLWMYVPGVIDGKPTDPAIPMSWDDMMPKRQLPEATDWLKVDIVLDVPQEAPFILFGMRSGPSGQVWLDDVQLEIVGLDVPSTNPGIRLHATNLDFEQGLAGWDQTDGETGHTEIGTGTEMAYSGKLGAYIKHTGGGTDSLGGLNYSYLYGQYYRDKQVTISGYFNVDKAPQGVIFIAQLYYLDDNGKLATPLSDRVRILPRPSGVKGWQKVEVKLQVPDRAKALIFWIGPNADGEVWVDDFQIIAH